MRNTLCPVAPYDQAGVDYAAHVTAWLENPHAFFTAFGPEARAFQRGHRSERLRTMTLVARAAELMDKHPLCLCVDGVSVSVDSWQEVFSVAAARLIAAHPRVFASLQQGGLLDWMGCTAMGEGVGALLAAARLRPTFASLEEVIVRVQWLFLMCGIRLNEVIVQVDAYTDEQWKVRKQEIDRRRAEDRAFLEGRRAAQKAWAEEHSEADRPAPRKHHFLMEE